MAECASCTGTHNSHDWNCPSGRITAIEDNEARRLAIIDALDKLSKASNDDLISDVAELNKQMDETMMQVNLRQWIVNNRMAGKRITREGLERSFQSAPERHTHDIPEHVINMLFGEPKGGKH